MSCLVQIFENENYSIRDILRDNRKVDFESYLRKGALDLEITTKSPVLRQVWKSYLNVSFLFTKYIEEMEFNNFFVSQMDLL